MLVLTVGSEARTRKYLPDLPITREVDLVCAERGASNDELLAAAPDASVVVADAISPIDAQLIAAMPNLKLIHSEGVAFNAIDVEAARARGIAVCNCAGVNAGTVAEQAVMLMLMCLRRALEGDRAVREGRQIALKERMMVEGFRELGDCTVGFVGFGAIGQATARYLRPWGCKMLYNKRKPLFNRAVKAKYPPGSTFKLVQGLIGLQEGVLRPSDLHSCHMGYQAGRLKMACHAHASPLDLRFAVATSCNAYFCYVFRDILDNPKYGSVKEGYDVWKQYVESFGFGRKLGSDFLDEGNGYVPDRAYYDRQYRGSWNSLTVLSLSIGQDALGCTPLQLANLACIVANRGYYYIPHIVKKIEGQDSLDARFYERHYTMVEPKHFEPIVEGMWRGVNVGGTSTRARLEGLDVCGKTGTAENPRGRDHSTFLSFAPKDNPKIAISVYVENGGFGASAALPIASLLEEYYLTDTIRRPELLQYIKDMNIYYPAYDK